MEKWVAKLGNEVGERTVGVTTGSGHIGTVNVLG
jgi:hypothetical protein